MNVGDKIVIALSNEYVEGKIVGFATGAQNQMLIKVESDQLATTPQWFPFGAVYKIN